MTMPATVSNRSSDHSTPIADFNDCFGVEWSDERFDTVAGIVMKHLGHLPRRGETLTIGELELRVLRADRRRIDALRVIPPRDLPSPEERGSGD